MAAPVHNGTMVNYAFVGEGETNLVGVQPGELVVVNVRWYGTGTISTLNIGGSSGGSGGTTIPLQGSPQTGGPDNSRSQWGVLEWSGSSGDKLIYCNISGGPSAGFTAWRVSGHDSTTPVGARNGASGSGTSVSVTLTDVPAECIGFAIGTNNGSGDWTSPGDSWSTITVTDVNWYDSGMQKADLGSAGNKTVSATVGSSTWVVNAIAIQPAGGGGSAIATHRYMDRQRRR